LVIEKWIDDVFIWSSENGKLTIEIPSGWYTRGSGFKFIPTCKLALWKKKHQKQLNDLKKLSLI